MPTTTKVVPTREDVLAALDPKPESTDCTYYSPGDIAWSIHAARKGVWYEGIAIGQHVSLSAINKALAALIEEGLVHALDRMTADTLWCGSTRAVTVYASHANWERHEAKALARSNAGHQAYMQRVANEIVLERHADEVLAEVTRLLGETPGA